MSRTLEEEMIWAAGLFDGEGYAAIFKRKVQTRVALIPIMALSMTHFEAVEHFAWIVDTGSVQVLKPPQPHYSRS